MFLQARVGILVGVLIFLLASCKKEVSGIGHGAASLYAAPPGFPSVAFPEDNLFTMERYVLGKRLFFDPIMSKDSTISCGSCHQPSLAFSDDVAFSIGSGGLRGRRNAPSLANVAYHPYFTREGGVPTLEMQVLVPIQEHDEFNHNIVEIAELLNQDPSYVSMSLEAYDRIPDHFVITRALATFERTLISGDSRYDREFNQGMAGVLTREELRGKALFFGQRTMCSSCHGGFNFTNYTFENNGLYETYPDAGRFRLTSDSADLARFKVPGLRNIELTAPYMHDGSMGSLEEVLEHYNAGGTAHFNKSDKIKALHLNEQEKSDLISFLLTLTDHQFIQNSNHRPHEE